MKRVLITGGCGFIGQNTIDYLLSLNKYKITILDNLSNSTLPERFKNNTNIDFIYGDICDMKLVNDIFTNNVFDYVLHLAANVSVVKSMEEPEYSRKVNIDGFCNILELSCTHKVKRFIYASSAAVYGNSDLKLSENSIVNPISNYGIEKLTNEYFAKVVSKNYALETVGLRYFNVYGPFQRPDSPYSGVISILLDKIKNNKEFTIFGDGQQSRDFIYVKDIARINEQVLFWDLGIDKYLILNCGTGVSIPLLDIIKALEKNMKNP